MEQQQILRISLSVTGTASLAGALNVTLGGTISDLNSSTSLTVLNTSGGITGSFTNVAFGSRILSPDKSKTFEVSRTAAPPPPRFCYPIS